ncbi:D-alanyl-D-alanine carboxypeptidase family protein [Lactobacillus xylocopicola]|uniref:D-alanyl-D-alanine carboxypeptidase n=1 Tax=Lactobacillus xylocopicola TaxID=2976676 RepID=A0ABN6SK68_9LACO|nr:D-alanyl-D-alanine carboxypeptidase family protein [Lactobacillus xylocopicola]BDR60776.1 D-alanyl-D-alanine carboxypeptidase [Lactobacillus xylocopicola]
MFEQRLKRLILVGMAALLLLIPTHVNAAGLPDDYHQAQLGLEVKSAIAIDSKTGQLLYGKNINQALPIASMTKLLTVYLTHQAIAEHKISWDTKVKPTAQIVAVSANRGFSNVPLKAGHTYTIKQLYQATLIQSANGAAMMLAQAVSGSQLDFVRQMRAQLEKWGIDDARIYTTCGLPNKSVGSDSDPAADKNAENEMSAKDMAIVGKNLLADYPEVVRTTRIARLDFIDQGQKTSMTNFNWMLKGLPQHRPSLEIDGLKTGTTDAAGACFIATAKHQGARVITVVMGARHVNGTDPARFEQTSKLLNYLFQSYHPIIFKKNEAIIGNTSIKVHNGQASEINIGMKTASELWLPRGQKLTVDLTNNRVEAPIEVGEIASYYRFRVGDRKLLAVQGTNDVELPAKAMQSTKKVNFLIRLWRWLFGG